MWKSERSLDVQTKPTQPCKQPRDIEQLFVYTYNQRSRRLIPFNIIKSIAKVLELYFLFVCVHEYLCYCVFAGGASVRLEKFHITFCLYTSISTSMPLSKKPKAWQQ